MISFSSTELSYHISGKFIAESDTWTHYSRPLNDYELMLVTEGTLYIANEETEFTVNPGEYLIMSPCNYQHGFKPSRCSFYWLHVYCNSDLSSSGKKITVPHKSTLPAPERVIVLLKQLQDSDRRYSDQNFNSILAAAVLKEIELQTNHSAESEQKYSQEHLLEEIKEYIKWHLREPLKVSEIADYFGYNEKYLTTIFRQITGIAIKQFILQTKMEQAKISLSDSNLQISEIAYNLGFDDNHNFSNAFKKITGLSPSEYKRNYSKEQINREK